LLTGKQGVVKKSPATTNMIHLQPEVPVMLRYRSYRLKSGGNRTQTGSKSVASAGMDFRAGRNTTNGQIAPTLPFPLCLIFAAAARQAPLRLAHRPN
jgi:hypothetical protein